MHSDLPVEYKKAFKDADIRGIYPSEINEVVAYRTARAFVELFKLKKVLVGRDMRLSSPALRNAFIAGAIESGANVVDLGVVSTPLIYFASGTYDMFGVVITASHNPKEYNGMKLVKNGAVPLTNASGLKEIQKLIQKNKFKNAKKKGKVTKKHILRTYKKYVLSKVNVNPSRKIRLVADAGNGMATELDSLLCKELPLKTKKLFFKLDGTFPNRGSNPTLKKNQKAIIAELKTGKYDFGVAFDGDVDRVAFFDEKGRYINSAVIGALITKHFLTLKPKQSFVYTVFTSKIYEQTIKKYGGKAIRARVGHAFIKEKMLKYNVRFGCEHSAHFYFQGNFHADSGILALLYLLDAYSDAMKEGKSFGDMLKEFQIYYQTEEILVKVNDKKKALIEIEKIFKKKKPLRTLQFDGVTVTFKDYWFVVKKSVTEDALKFVVEAHTKKLAEAKKEEIYKLLKGM